jgi:chaperonin cofactor prefoldin
MSDLMLIVGSLGGLAGFIATIVEVAKRFNTWRSDRRKAEAEADGINIDNLQKLQSVWGEQFASMNRDMEELRSDMRQARESWEAKRADLQQRVEHLESVVDRLRAQIRDELGGVPVV